VATSLQEQIKEFFANFEKGPLIGLDIGINAVKVAYMTPGRKGTYKLENYGSIALSEAAIIEDQVQKHEEVIEAIGKSIKKAGIKKHKIINLGMDGPNTVTKRLQVPDGTKEDVEDNILWEAEQYIPFGADDSELDYSIVGTIEEEDVKDAIVAASRTDVVDQFIEIVKEAGMQVRNVDLNVFAISNLFEVVYADKLKELSENGAIIIDFGAQTTTIIVYKNGAPLLTKEINLGGVLITEEIQRSMSLSYEEAEDLKTMGDENGNLPEEILAIITEQIERLLTELKKVLNFYITAGSSDQVGSCYVCGGSSRLPGLIENLQNVVGVEVELFNPFEKITYDKKKFNQEELEQIATSGIVAMGLALREI
jgi:type IV pilus assembly protein PilM